MLEPEKTSLSARSHVDHSPLNTVRHLVLDFAETLLRPLKERDFLLLFSGQTISTFGDAFYTVALPWIILTSGGSPQQLGITLAAYGIPRVITILLGGILSDRIHPRWVMLLADVARAVLVGLMAFLVLRGALSQEFLLVIVAGLGIFAGLFIPASYSILPSILPQEKLQAGNALNSSMLQLATLIGAGIAGFVVAQLQTGLALAIDAFTFIISMFALMAMRPRSEASQLQKEESVEIVDDASTPHRSLTEKITFIQLLRRSRLFQVTLLVVAVTFLTSGGTMGVALPALAHGALSAGAGGYGLLLACFVVGELVGGLGAGGLGHLPRRPIIVLVLQIGQALAFAVFPLFGGLFGVAVVLVIAGILNGLINVMYFTLIQELFPAHLMGRIWGVVMFATYGLYPVSVALGGVVTDRFGPSTMFFASGIVLAVAAVIGLLQQEIRKIA